MSETKTLVCPVCRRRVKAGRYGGLAKHGFKRGLQNGPGCPGWKTLLSTLIQPSQPSQHGGARIGAGKKPTGRTKIRRQFSLSPATVQAMEKIEGEHSKFVNEAILEKLGIK